MRYLSLHLVALLAILTFAIPVFAEQPAGLVRIAEVVNGHIHPSICRSKNGVLVAAYGRINHRDLRLTRSRDNGKTWSAAEPFPHTAGKSYYPGSLTALADGRIVHCWNRWSTPTNEQEPRSVLYAISSDDGATWSEPAAFPRDEKVRSVIRHPFVELDADRWLATIDDRTLIFHPSGKPAEPLGDGRNHGLTPIVRTPKGTFISGAGLRSTDGGKSWQPITGMPDIKTQGWRHELVCLSDGVLLASEILGPGFGGERIRYAISHDDGLTWDQRYEYYAPGRPINGRACPRTVELSPKSIGVVFYDIDAQQPQGPSLYFLEIPRGKLDKK
jgi:hypothetical protein